MFAPNPTRSLDTFVDSNWSTRFSVSGCPLCARCALHTFITASCVAASLMSPIIARSVSSAFTDAAPAPSSTLIAFHLPRHACSCPSRFSRVAAAACASSLSTSQLVAPHGGGAPRPRLGREKGLSERRGRRPAILHLLRLFRIMALRLVLSVALSHSEYRSRVPNGEVVAGVRALGHTNLKGGGSLNHFGVDFRAAGYRWTPDLCRKDSDGDGESNGLELGDPCCVWREGGGPPMRSWRISHPGMKRRIEGITQSGVAMPNCSVAEAPHAASSLGERVAKDHAIVQGASFAAFYYTNSFYNRGHKQVFKLELGTQLVLAMLLGFVGLALCEARWACLGGSTSCRRRTSLRERCKLHLCLLFAAVVYVDILSGLLHIVLDNPSFTTLPLLGPGAVGLQSHTQCRGSGAFRAHGAPLKLLDCACRRWASSATTTTRRGSRCTTCTISCRSTWRA